MYEIFEKTIEEIAKSIGKNAAIGGAVDGALAVVDEKNILKEVGCGATTAASGAAAREAFEYFVKDGGKWSHIISISASIGARYIYRRACGDLDNGEEA